VAGMCAIRPGTQHFQPSSVLLSALAFPTNREHSVKGVYSPLDVHQCREGDLPAPLSSTLRGVRFATEQDSSIVAGSSANPAATGNSLVAYFASSTALFAISCSTRS
jgi:hypothetical protein